MTGRRPILLLVNPDSGGKAGAPTTANADEEARRPEALRAALASRGVEARLHPLGEEDDIGELAARAATDGCDVVAVGGDGTVAPVAAALCRTPATLGILPLGSWNNVARAFGIPNDLEAALDVIAHGETGVMDSGLVWHPAPGEAADADPPPDAARFFEAAGVGLDAAGFGASEISERYGILRAVRAAWRALRRRRTAMRLEVDGRRLGTWAPAVVVCNGPYMGLGFAIAPDADAGDGRLNVVVFSNMTRWDVMRHFAAVARRRPRREPRMVRLTARQVEVTGVRRVLPAHADGRSIGTTPVRFAVDAGVLRVFR